MKQHITLDQLNELSPRAKERLREWATNKAVTWTYPEDLPELSIGQMIEFLDIKSSNPYDGGFIDMTSNGEWMVFNGPYYYAPELCDALWEAVKEVLEDE